MSNDTWQAVQKSAYLADFVELNKNLQQAVVRAVEELEQDPVTPRGNTIKKLTGYENVWRYRLGDYRLIYAVDRPTNLLRLLAIGPRSSIYQRFNYDGWDAPEAAREFGPQLAQTTDWAAKQREWSQPTPQAPQRDRLPRKLTPALLTRWRIDPQYHPALMRCLYDEDLIKAMDRIPSDVVGRVMDGLFPADVERLAAQPDQVLLDPADLTRYAEGTLSGFLLRLDENQRPLVDWALRGPTLIKGGPGSGKSTVALYRIQALVARHVTETGAAPEILFTTYTNSLTSVSESLLRQLLREPLGLGADRPLPRAIRITTLHKTARWITSRSGKSFRMAGVAEQASALNTARRQTPDHPALGRLRDDYLLEEFAWVIEGQDCREEATYLAASRAGRGIPLGESARRAVWQLYTRFRTELEEGGYCTWTQMVQLALDAVRAGEFQQRWDYVVVDEAQDLRPVELALCVELCRSAEGVFLTADANQSLYNKGFRWSQVHADLNVTGRSRILRRNYRSTEEIAAAAAEILTDDDGLDAEAAQQTCIHGGPYPVIYAAGSSDDQARWIGRQLYEAAREMRLPLNAAVVLVSSSSVGRPLAQALSNQGLAAKFMNSSQFDLDDPSLKVTTLHAAKGLEFPIVAVAHVEAGRLPRETDATDDEELAAYLASQRRLFYVGCTRAMRYLFVSFDRQLPSPFVEGLSEERWMWVED